MTAFWYYMFVLSPEIFISRLFLHHVHFQHHFWTKWYYIDSILSLYRQTFVGVDSTQTDYFCVTTVPVLSFSHRRGLWNTANCGVPTITVRMYVRNDMTTYMYRNNFQGWCFLQASFFIMLKFFPKTGQTLGFVAKKLGLFIMRADVHRTISRSLEAARYGFRLSRSL